VSNHTHNLDGVFIQYFWKKQISFVANDTAWKIKSINWILDIASYIPIRKMTTDSVAVRKIFDNIKNGRIVGIFPEGKRSWAGHTETIVPSTANLIKKLKVPLITVNIKGAMMSKPRWSYKSRRGKIILYPKLALTTDQIKNMSASEVDEVINKELYHDETEFLRNSPDLVFKGDSVAECLELFLFVCNECANMKTMISEGDKFYCSHCGSEYTYLRDGSLAKADQSSITLLDWDKYQRRIIADLMQNAPDDYVMFEDESVTFFKYIRNKPLELIATGKISITPKAIIFRSSDNNLTSLLIKDMCGINIQQNNQLELTLGKDTYRFLFNERVSPYKYEVALKTII